MAWLSGSGGLGDPHEAVGPCWLGLKSFEDVTGMEDLPAWWLTPTADILVPAAHRRPHFLFTWASLGCLNFHMRWHLTSPVGRGPRKQGGRCKTWHALASEVQWLWITQLVQVQ